MLNCVSVFVTPWTVAHQVLLSMGFPRQEYWSGSQCPPPGDLPDPGIELTSPVTWHRQILYPLSHWRSPRQAEKNGKQWKNKCGVLWLLVGNEWSDVPQHNVCVLEARKVVVTARHSCGSNGHPLLQRDSSWLKNDLRLA